MSKEFLKKGQVVKVTDFAKDLTGDGDLVEIHADGYQAFLMAVWRMSHGERSLKCEAMVSRVIHSVNALQHVPLEVLEAGVPMNMMQKLADYEVLVQKMVRALEYANNRIGPNNEGMYYLWKDNVEYAIKEARAMK